MLDPPSKIIPAGYDYRRDVKEEDNKLINA